MLNVIVGYRVIVFFNVSFLCVEGDVIYISNRTEKGQVQIDLNSPIAFCFGVVLISTWTNDLCDNHTYFVFIGFGLRFSKNQNDIPIR